MITCMKYHMYDLKFHTCEVSFGYNVSYVISYVCIGYD